MGGVTTNIEYQFSCGWNCKAWENKTIYVFVTQNVFGHNSRTKTGWLVWPWKPRRALLQFRVNNYGGFQSMGRAYPAHIPRISSLGRLTAWPLFLHTPLGRVTAWPLFLHSPLGRLTGFSAFAAWSVGLCWLGGAIENPVSQICLLLFPNTFWITKT